MSDPDIDDIARLDQAWSEIEKAVRDLGVIIRRESAGLDALHRYEGYKTALAIIAENYINQVHYDKMRPECLPSVGSLLNHSAPSPDFIYRMAHLEPGASYRVWGSRGEAKLIDFQMLTNWWGRYQGAPPAVPTLGTVANLSFDSQDAGVDAQGNFDFILSPQPPHAGHWWKLAEGVNTILIREYFTNYSSQNRSAVIHFDRTDIKNTGATVLGMNEATDRLSFYTRALYDWSTFLPTANHVRGKVGDNQHWEPNYSAQAAVSDQRYFLSRLNVKPMEALVCQWTIPEDAEYWSTALYDHWFRELNYGNRQVNLNEGLAKLSAGRTLHFVISHEDPGVANWLDLDGHQQGILQSRTKGCKGSVGPPQMRLVPVGEVREHLPKGIAMISTAERQRELAVRRRHFQLREGR